MIQTVYLTLAGNISQQEVYAVQADRNLSVLRCVLRGYEGAPEDAALLRATKPDGSGACLPGERDSEGSFRFTVTEQLTEVAGDVHCDLCITRGEDRISSDTFLLKVRPPAATEEETPETGKTLIRVNCTDQALQLSQCPTVASGGFNEDKIAFSFGSVWDGFTKTAVFYVEKENVYHVLLDENNTCTIPHEVLQHPGKMFFGVFGVNSDNITRTSETVKYKIVQGAITEDLKPSDPTPDIYEQILAKLNTSVLGISNIEESDEDGGSNVVTFTNGATLTVKNGRRGSPGADGKNGTDGKNGVDGKNGEDGKDGESISVVSVSESTEDGGSNVVTFSDGSTLTVKNGSAGAGAGASITVDTELSEESENPVQNKVITTQFNAALDGVSQGMDQMEQAIMTLYTAMYSALATPASVDMSGFESGTIVETFADGTTKTTTIEFDTNGNPVKITDGNGRVTTYVW